MRSSLQWGGGTSFVQLRTGVQSYGQGVGYVGRREFIGGGVVVQEMRRGRGRVGVGVPPTGGEDALGKTMGGGVSHGHGDGSDFELPDHDISVES
eukprot:756936-Hanusia_phi.AAC.2